MYHWMKQLLGFHIFTSSSKPRSVFIGYAPQFWGPTSVNGYDFKYFATERRWSINGRRLNVIEATTHTCDQFCWLWAVFQTWFPTIACWCLGSNNCRGLWAVTWSPGSSGSPWSNEFLGEFDLDWLTAFWIQFRIVWIETGFETARNSWGLGSEQWWAPQPVISVSQWFLWSYELWIIYRLQIA